MTDLSRSRLWVMRLSFVALALVILFFAITIAKMSGGS